MNYQGRGRATITFMDGTQQVFNDLELKVKPELTPSPPPPRGGAFKFSVPMRVLINWPALTQFQKLEAECVRARVLGVPDEELKRFVLEALKRNQATCGHFDVVEAVRACVTAFFSGASEVSTDELKAAFDELNKASPPAVHVPPPSGSTKRKLASWKTRHYGPQR